MKTCTTTINALVALAAASVAHGWTINAYQCSDCSGCPAYPISGTGTTACTFFDMPLSSVSSEAQVGGCQVYLYYGLASCQAGAGAQQPGDGQCVPEGGSNNYYYAVQC